MMSQKIHSQNKVPNELENLDSRYRKQPIKGHYMPIFVLKWILFYIWICFSKNWNKLENIWAYCFQENIITLCLVYRQLLFQRAAKEMFPDFTILVFRVASSR